jgi:uracil-DNA glycosylase
MLLAMRDLIDQLAALPGSDRLFNPYADGYPGAQTRRDNLTRYLADMLSRRPRIVMLFEAPGYRGCALSGIPVTSERIMLGGIRQWGLFGDGYQATSGDPKGVSEMTATILWGGLQELADHPPLIWNTVPLHPHRPDERQSNRAPTVRDIQMGLPFIEHILTLYQPDTLLAVGRVAQGALASLGRSAVPLRHPSQGGKPEFMRGLSAVYRHS